MSCLYLLYLSFTCTHYEIQHANTQVNIYRYVISVGWLMHSSYSVLSSRWQNLGPLFWNTLEMLNKRFRWLYLLFGFLTLSFAAVSWKLESNSSYWIWHRCESSFLVNTSNFCFESLACVDFAGIIANNPLCSRGEL